jgi:hypothetical protein
VGQETLEQDTLSLWLCDHRAVVSAGSGRDGGAPGDRSERECGHTGDAVWPDVRWHDYSRKV